MQAPHRMAFLGHHKCATTFLGGITKAAARAAGLTPWWENLWSRLPLHYERDPAQAARIAYRYRLLATRAYDVLCHVNADMAVIATLAQRGDFRAFHVIRDPRDIMVSGYFWHISDRSMTPKAANLWDDDRRQRLRAAADQESALLLEVDFCACYLDSIAEWDYTRPDILELRYEDMVADPTAFVARAFDFIGMPPLPDGGLARLMQDFAFEKLSGGRALGEESRSEKYRKGLPGDWRNHFTPRITEAFKQRHGALLIHLGYEKDLDW